MTWSIRLKLWGGILAVAALVFGLALLFNQRQSRQQLAPSDIRINAFDWPNPDGIGIDPAECLAIEDSPTGAQAALAAGMTVVGFCGASHIVDRAAHGEMLRSTGVHRLAFAFDEISIPA